MSRRAMMVLILAIIAIHGILLWLLFATDSAEQQLSETRKQLEEEIALHSETERGSNPFRTQTEPGSSVQLPESSGGASSAPSASPAQTPGTVAAQTSGNAPADRDPLAGLTTVKEKPQPSVPSTTYVRKPKKITPVKLDYSGAVQNDIAGLKGASLATAGILIDMDNNKVLWAKNPSKPVPVASLTKIMTIMLSYEIAMDDSSPYTLESLIPVTTEAINTPASKVDFRKGEMFTIRELLVAASVRSANDAAHLLAEHLGGGKADKFIEDMNRRAKEIGMTHTTYFNAHGLPGKSRALDNQSSPEDIARLCLVFRQYFYLMELAALRSAPFREKGSPNYMMLQNHNNLLPGAKVSTAGVNGIKTGFTNRAGFCLAASCERSGRHLLAVATGFPSAADRDNFVHVLLDWGYTKIGVSKPKAASSSSKSASSAKKTSTTKGR
jgi:D-alanyl-D-alanine carboxypeptidase (penicillin-binding protein 5/6)